MALASPTWGQNLSQQFREVKEKAEQGSVQAQFRLAQMFELGLGTDTDYQQSLHWYRKSAAQGYAGAEYKLGGIYYRGRFGTTKNLVTAHKWMLSSAKHGYTAAQTLIAKMYALGQGVPKNKAKANYWRKKSFKSKTAELEEEIIALTQAMEEKKQEVARKKAEKAHRKKEIEHNKKAKAQAAAAKKRLAAAVQDKTKKLSFKDAKGVKNLVLDAEWSSRNKPVTYLPSAISVCDDTQKGLVCSSEEQFGKRGGTEFRYKVKSFILNFTNQGKFHVRYRNRITLITSSTDGTAMPMKIGWQKKTHTLDCKLKSSNKINCVKDGRFNREYSHTK